MDPARHRHLLPVVDRIRQLPATDPPGPWERRPVYGVGGLREVGFDPATGLLLVVSSQGRGVFDCHAGAKLARDDAEFGDWHDEPGLEATGIGPLAGVRVRLSGLAGGGLPRLTRDGWATDVFPFDWPDEYPVLSAPGCHPLDQRPGRYERVYKVDTPACEVRAFGFSPDGRVLLLATSADITFWVRPA